MLLIVPSTIVIPRDGSFTLAFLGRVRRVHDPVFLVALDRNNLALKRIVDLVSCRLTSFMLIILSVFQSKFFSWSCRIEEVFFSCVWVCWCAHTRRTAACSEEIPTN